MKIKFNKLILVTLIGLVSGCATIMGNDSHTMPIGSNPGDAEISITDEKGVEVFKGVTPTTVTLKKSDGSYFGKKNYTVKISKPGYETTVIPVTASANGYYIAGNLLFGGLIGYLIVDPMNGKMYNLSPESISSTMTVLTKTSKNSPAINGEVAIMMLQDVPAELRAKMEKLN